METKVYNISELQFEHRLWKSEMKIILGELNVYQEWLSSSSLKSFNIEFQKKINLFQNKFDIQRNHFDSFNDRINASDSYMASLEKITEDDISDQTIADNTNLRADINVATDLYKDLKKEYVSFARAAKF